MQAARSRHEIFETDFQAHNYGSQPFKKWWTSKWYEQIDTYAHLGWAMVPIAVRGKSPLKAQDNYLSRGAAGPYLSVEEAYKWVLSDFNLAVSAGPSGILWCDMDDPQLFKDSLMRGLVMRTPRGYAIPLKADNQTSTKRVQALKARGFDFREDITYELVPLSETCMFDHGLQGAKHPGPRETCVNSHTHNYRVREWITPMTNPILSFHEFCEAVSV